MPDPERRPAQSQPQIWNGKDRFAALSSHFRGVLIRIEPGTQLPDLKGIAEELYPVAREHAERDFQIKGIQSQQVESDKKIKTLAQTHEGLRGVQSDEENFILNVFPKERVTYDPELLKKSLGVAYSTLVHEDLQIALQMPAAFHTEKGPVQETLVRQVITQALLDLGLSEDDLKTIMKAQVAQRVDEKALEKMIKADQVNLLPGAKIIDETWAITVTSLKTPNN